MLFKAFDVDAGGTLDRQELEKFLICGISGLCKMVGLSAPSRIGITEFTYEQFKIIDEDESGTIEQDEFDHWVSTTQEIQDFLCTYTGVQTYAFAKKRFEAEKEMWSEFFKANSFTYFGTQYTEIQELIEVMDKKLSHMDKNVRQKLFYLFDYEGATVISLKQFDNIMMIWSAFSANDINNDNELDAQEIKQLFWLFDGQKPTIQKIMREKEIMDADNSGTIDRLEWMAYLCSTSVGDSKEYIDFGLRESFENADTDKDGLLGTAEIAGILKGMVEQNMKYIPEI